MTKFKLQNHHKGMLWIILSVFCFTVVNAVIKETTARYPLNEIVFFRFFFAIIPTALILFRTHGRSGFVIKKPTFQILRALFGVVGLSTMFYSFGHMPLADSMAISFSVTLFAVIFALPILKERPTQKHLLAVLLGFAGVIFIAKPTGHVWSIAAVCGIVGAAMDSITLTTGRKLALNHVTPEQTSFFFCIVATIVSALTLPFSGVIPQGTDWAMLFLLGFGGGVAQYCITKGFAMAPAAVAAPMIYTASVWSVLIGYIFWSEVPLVTTFVGMGMIIAGGVYIGYLQSRKATAIK